MHEELQMVYYNQIYDSNMYGLTPLLGSTAQDIVQSKVDVGIG